jgi:3-hydroxyisobutyrate dehydrogenase-like beta-hydroxyacid dehydrogenase
LPDKNIGFVGLGDQGAPMAERVLAAGWNLGVYARRQPVRDAFVDRGATAVATLRELGSRSDVVEVVVRDDDEVTDVLLGADNILAGMRPGSVLVVHSTVHPDTCRDLASVGAGRGVAFLDAPVSGGPVRAQAGELTVMVGGDQDVFASVEPVFRSFGSLIRRVGPVGAGQLTKLINNFFAMAHEATAFDAAALMDAAGLDRAAAVDILSVSTGSSEQFRKYAARDFQRQDYPRGDLARVAMMEKDLRLLNALDLTCGVDLTATVQLITAYLDRSRATARDRPS